ncbi:hypothetical protein ZHAS_00012257 [Anopheles sinensis]|uniref:Uncharacterized protein n=1 Tax=Anopheles sinensis TaxID=74873 RepID=A0A084W2M5_ANOSI|nr:hypothetical protein ZHAS_00012257 [Anopheles sinensis]
MLQPAQRKLILFNTHPMAIGCIKGAQIKPYFSRHAAFPRQPVSPVSALLCMRSIHQSSSQVSVKEITPIKASNITGAPEETEMRPNQGKQLTSIIQTLHEVQWSSLFIGFRHRLTLANAVYFVRKLPANMAAGYSLVINSREYELASRTVIIAWQLSVRIVRSAYFWLGVFLESREYFYLRYYTLLGLERAIGLLRYGLRLSFQLLRSALEKK